MVAASGRVAIGEMTKAAYAKLESAVGFRSNPHGIASSTALKGHIDLPDVINYDWVHSALQGGVVTCEVEALLAATRTPRSELQTFLASPAWRYPGITRQKARYLHRVFDPRRVGGDDPDKVKATCSELLGLYGMLRCFFDMKYGSVAEFRRHLECFFLLCRAMDLILALKFGFLGIDAASVGELQAVLCRHLREHIALYGEGHVRPKHHWLVDCPSQFLRDQLVLDAFVIERTHLSIKQLAEDVKNTRSYERSVLSGFLCGVLRDSRELGGDRLLGRTALLPGSAARVADRAEVQKQEFTVGEIVLKSGEVAELKACALEASELFFVVQRLQLVGEASPHYGTYERVPGLVVWPARAACHALAWRPRSNGSLFVLSR